MSLAKQTLGFSREAVEELSSRKAEPDWMRRFRLQGWELFEAMPWPTQYSDEWRRTDIRGLKLQTIAPFAEAYPRTSELPDEISATGDIAQRGALLVDQDGRTLTTEVQATLREQGVLFCDLDAAVRAYPEVVREQFMTSCVTPGYNKFTALHAAFWSGGALLVVPRGADVALPLQASFWTSAPNSALFPHAIVVAEPGSRVTYIDQYLSRDCTGDEQSLNVPVTELFARPGSEIRYIHLQQLGTGAWNFGVQRALLERDSRVRFLTVGLGAAFSKTNIDAILAGPGSETEMLGFYFPDGSQFCDFHTLQEHIAPHTTSDLLFKGALKDTARSVFSGLINVHPGAQKTNAYQNNKNLLLSGTARADSNPKLEIGANDVRCTHGATIGQVDKDQIFYLMCRGVPRVQAERLIVEGFFDPILQRIPLPGVRERLRASIDEKIV